MAGSILNIRIITKSAAHSLRAISVVTFPPTFFILLIQGIASKRVNPAIGVLPLFFSSAFSLFLLANERNCGCQNSELTGTPIHFIFDILLGTGLLVCLILTWVFLPHSRNGGMVMLGTYGTNSLIANFLVHVYFVMKQLYDAVTPGSNYPSSCQQCQYGPFANNLKMGARHGYAPLLDQQGRPANSTEEELPHEGESAV